ncbi:MAG: tetratricopeptide repeat protein [Nitrospirae bacterium]|nr:tetratricopeptide repeat protein [Nitrospirota bacterium]
MVIRSLRLMKKQHLKYYLAAAVSLLTFGVYLYALHNDFVEWDDSAYVYANPHIRAFSPAFFRWAFFDFYASNWHPLTWISHALDYALWGLNPLGHHLTGNILHAANTFIVVVLVAKLLEVAEEFSGFVIPASAARRESFRTALKDSGQAGMTENGRMFSGKGALIAAATTGLLFGLHPLHVESVAWVAERKDLLCALFFLLSVRSYMSYAAKARYKSYRAYKTYSLSLCLFVLALLSKPMAVSLPLVLLILDWYPFQRIRSLKTFRDALIEKLPFIALSIASSILTVFAQKAGDAMEAMRFVPLPVRLLAGAKSLFAYLWKMILPMNLVPFYPYPNDVSLFSFGYLFALFLFVAITVICFTVARKYKLWLSVWSYYLITLFPVLGIIQVGSQAMADRYAYLPSLGPFLVAGLVAARIYKNAAALKQWKSTLRMAGIAAAVAVMVALSYGTLRQIGIWKNGLALWNYVIEEEPLKVPHAYNNRGFILLGKGLIDEAAEQFRIAISLDPGYADAYNNLCLAYKSKGLFASAIEQCRTAVGLKPDYAEAHNNLGVAYKSEGLSEQAMEQYRTALTLKPDYAEAYFNLGIIYLERGDRDMARRSFESGLRIKPDDYKAQQVLNYLIPPSGNE